MRQTFFIADKAGARRGIAEVLPAGTIRIEGFGLTRDARTHIRHAVDFLLADGAARSVNTLGGFQVSRSK